MIEAFVGFQNHIHAIKDMQAEKFYYRLVFTSIFICHIFAAAQFWIKRPELEIPAVWTGQFYVLLGLSWLCSILFFFYRDAALRGKLYFVAARLLVFIVLGYGEGSYLGVEFTLLTLLLLEISAYFGVIPSIVLTCGITAVTLLNQQPIKAWGTQLSGVPLHDLLSLSVYAALVAILANTLHVVVKQLDSQTQTADRLNHAVSQLIDANIGFQEYAVTAGEKSTVRERKRISRDIHDTAVHTFVNIIMLTETAIDAIETQSGKILPILQQLITIARDGVRDTRQALRELRAIDEASLRGIQAIQQLINVFEEITGVQVTIDYSNLPWEFEAQENERALYRMIQEGLTNAFRHGKATMVNVYLRIIETSAGSELTIRIRDNGQGAGHITKGIGLHGMEERLQKLRGQLEFKNVPGGFELLARIPLSRHKGK